MKKIYIPNLPKGGRDIYEQFDVDLLNSRIDSSDIQVVHVLELKGRIVPQGDEDAMLKSVATTSISQRCGRCLESRLRDVTFHMNLLIKPLIYEKDDVDDVGLHYYRDTFLILDDLVVEHLILQLDFYWVEEKCEDAIVYE